MKVLFLEPFFGGSHQDFATGFAAHSRHDVTMVTLPASSWKWRMRGAALAFLQKIKDIASYDLVFATDMMNVADFLALAGPSRPPLVLYFHENQLSYPLSFREKKKTLDVGLGFINITSALAADQVLFNSGFHLNVFAKEARKLIKQMPGPRPSQMVNRILEKTRVVYPGCRFPAEPVSVTTRSSDPPLIIWNHRWEYDKQPEVFFRVLGRLRDKGVPFSLAVMGERYDRYPEVFDSAKQTFGGQIKVFGYVPSRAAYHAWLARGSVVVSTAIQENFGISVVEAVRFGCFPLLPRRLSYPEIMPGKYHPDILYRSETQLFEKLTYHLLHPEANQSLQKALCDHVQQFSWEISGPQYDNLLENCQKKGINPAGSRI
jgi:glycosyltransferase involved in cell wall biosynthesis